MNQLATTKTSAVATFEPSRTKEEVAKADALIDLAKRLNDWPLLETAVDHKIEEQGEFVRWWRENVRGKGAKSNSADRRYFQEDAETTTGISHQQVSKWGKWLKDRDKYRVRLFGAAWKAAMGALATESQLVQQSLSNEHYTPSTYIEAARLVLGGIDLDPASCPQANAVVRAKKFFTVKDDGLKQKWHGTVWLNPPYGGLAGQFIERLADDFSGGQISAGIALVNAHCTDTSWFQRLWEGYVCFTHHRINFAGDDTRSGSTHGSAFAYFGPDPGLFMKEFSRFGAVVRRA